MTFIDYAFIDGTKFMEDLEYEYPGTLFEYDDDVRRGDGWRWLRIEWRGWPMKAEVRAFARAHGFGCRLLLCRRT
jgi:hypothetical protein